MTSRILIANAVFLALVGMGIVSSAQGSIICSDVAQWQVEQASSDAGCSQTTQPENNGPQPSQPHFVLGAESTSGMSAPTSVSAGSSVVPAIISRVLPDVDQVSSPLAIAAFLAPKHPEPSSLLRPPIG